MFLLLLFSFFLSMFMFLTYLIYLKLKGKNNRANALEDNNLTHTEREKVLELSTILEHLYIFTNIIQGIMSLNYENIESKILFLSNSYYAYKVMV